MISVTLKGREIPLVYTVLEMKEMQEEIAPMSDLQYVLFGRNKDDPEDDSRYGSPEHLTAIAKMIRILGNGGLEEAGETPDLTDRWIMRAMKPVDLAKTVNTCMKAMDEGLKSEYQKKEQHGPVDVTLEKINKKKERDG